MDKPPAIEPHGEGFRVTLKSGDSETAFMLTMHAMSGLAERSRLFLIEARAKAALAEPTPLQFQEEWPSKKRRNRKSEKKE